MPRLLTVAVGVSFLLFLIAGPPSAEAGLLRTVKLTEKQKETVKKTDALLNQLLENIRRMYYENNPHLKPYPHEGFANEDYPDEYFSTEDYNPGTSIPTEFPLHINTNKEQKGSADMEGANSAIGREGLHVTANEKESSSVVDGPDGKEEHPVAADEGERGEGCFENAVDSINDYDDSRIWFPDK
ncbi:uncharacterized protein LOC122259869 [Penaeus japonicus]|uniref:uncharacterized protein LOC122259869 n=1 Tax=Penaeus japonicus TaxID=27405 RepID=UPI001C71376A|nr:uncharacterized protein LOC122259869 [Penaeus japonicus]